MNRSTPKGKSGSSPQRSAAGGLGRSLGTGALVIAVVVGIQLGSIPWRYRRQIWKLQGFLLGGLVGYVVGRLSAASPDDRKQRGDRPPRLPDR
jgi:hypothetical protein